MTGFSEKITNKVEQTMLSHGMTDVGSILAGLSGGADSAALVSVLCRLSEKYGFRVCAAHVNHGLRGEAADRDEEVSRSMAASLGIEFFSLRADVRAYAEEKGIGEEAAGREVRYAYFDRLMDEHGIELTATAHHRNDNAETILMNFMRGSSASGLCGIPYRRGRIVRPLLDITRAEIERYCDDNGIAYVTDATNTDESYTRNRIRHSLLPYIEREFNPAFVETVTNNAEIISRDEDYMRSETERICEKHVKDGSIDIDILKNMHPALTARVIRNMIAGAKSTEDVSSAAVDAVRGLIGSARTGAGVDIYGGVRASVSYGKLVIGERRGEMPEFSYTIAPGGSVYIPELGLTAHMGYAGKRDGSGEFFSFPGDPETAVFEIRNRRGGDVFVPWGMKGRKKLKNFMIDEKIPREKRSSVGIFTINGDIAWVIGFRRDDRFKFSGTGIKIWFTY